MADLFCSFLPLFLPPKRYFSSALHSHSSRISRIKTRPPHLPLHFKPSPSATSASNIDVISTHEHSDGTFLFRFGDPSEIVKNVDMEEAKLVKEEIEGEDTNGSSMVKVTEGEDESEVTTSGLIEATDDSIVSSSNTLIAVEGESEFSEKLLVETELPVLTSNKEIGVISSPDLDIEPIGLDEEYKDLSPVKAFIPDESSEIENNIAEVSYEEPFEETSKFTCTSEEMEISSIGVVEECPNEEDVDSPAEASTLDESSEVVDSATMVALLEKESDGISSADVDADENGKVEEGLDEDYEDTPVDVSVLDRSSEVGSGNSAVVLLGKETDGDNSTSDIEIMPTGNVEESINEAYEDSAVDITSAPDNATAALSEKETADVTLAPDIDLKDTGNEERGLDEILEEPSSVQKRPEVESCITAEELPEKETVDIATAPDIDIEYTGIEERGLDEVLEEPSSVEKRPEEENCITAQELLEKESVDVTSAPDMDIDQYTAKVQQGLDEVLGEPSSVEKRSEVETLITAQELLEKESVDFTSAPDVDIEYTVKVQQGLDEVLNEPSSVEKRSEVETHITAQELLEKESVDVTSAPDMDIEYTAKVQQGLDEVLDESSSVEKRSEVETRISAQELLEKEAADITSASDIDVEYTGNVEQGLNEVLEEPSPVERRSELENHIAAQELSEKETADITFVPDIAIEYTGNVEQGLDEVLDEPSSVEKRPEVENTAQELSEKETAEITTAPDIDIEYTGNEILEEPCLVEMRPEVANRITAEELLEKETADATTSVAFKTDPVVSVLDTDAGQGGLGTTVTPNELQYAVTAIHDETISDGRESFDNTLVSPSSQSEQVMNLYKETEAPNLQAEVQNLATEESTETDVNNVKAIEMQNLLSNDNKSDMYGAEEESPRIEPAMTLSLGSEEQASGSGSGMPNETVGYVSEKDVQLLTVSPQLEADSMLEEETGTQTVEELTEDDELTNQIVGGDLTDASVHEVTAPESTEFTVTSQEILMTEYVLSSGAALLPHPSKVLTGGEDAYFIADETWLGVADGVSQWSLEGTIPGVYAHELIRNCEKLISECSGNSIKNPIELLNLSVAQSHSPGSSTVLIARFDGQAFHVANVGDSGFIILRHGAVYKKSSPMHHVFSLPVQIERGDDPSSLAQLYRVELEEEDIIVTATDGLLDNLYDQEISLIATKSLDNDKSPKEVAELLAKKAQEVGSSASARSPFADDAQAAGFPGHTGGKLDDVAVIVSVVQRR